MAQMANGNDTEIVVEFSDSYGTTHVSGVAELTEVVPDVEDMFFRQAENDDDDKKVVKVISIRRDTV